MTDFHDRLVELRSLPLHGVTLIRLQDRHQPVTVETGVWRSKGRHPQCCRTCDVMWPCEVGQALAVIGWLLVTTR